MSPWLIFMLSHERSRLWDKIKGAVRLYMVEWCVQVVTDLGRGERGRPRLAPSGPFGKLNYSLSNENTISYTYNLLPDESRKPYSNLNRI